MGIHATRLSVRRAQAERTPGRHADGGNLYLNVTSSGAPWVFLYKRAGRRREMGLGSVADVSLARARGVAASYRQALAEGRDPLTLKNTAKALSFGEAADQFIESMSPQWRNPKHVAQWKMTLREYAGPIRQIGLEDISTEDILRVLRPIWTTKSETASRVRGRVEAVLNWASAKKLRSGENPARWRGHLDQLLPKRQRLSRGHHAAMAIDDLPDFMKRLAASSAV